MSQSANFADAAAEQEAKTVTPEHALTSRELADVIRNTLTEEKAEEIVEIDLQGRSEIADFMVICSGRSTRQVSALAEKLVDRLKRDYGRQARIEGKAQGDWVLIDVGDVIVHIFRPEVRDFYQLEKMWLQPERSSSQSGE